MKLPSPLASELLHTGCDVAALAFASTETLADLDAALIHGRAVEAIHLGLEIQNPGYNLYVLGDPGSGRHAVVRQLLDSERHVGPPPSDWCYVNNFSDPSHSRLLRMPAGRGARLRDDMQRFVSELGPAIAAVFESDDYRKRIESLQSEEKEREEQALRNLGQEASDQHKVALLRTPRGFVFAPMKDETTTLSQEEFEQLPEERQKDFSDRITSLHERLHQLMYSFRTGAASCRTRSGPPAQRPCPWW